MKIGIVGVGAMGCLFAAHLAPLAEVVMLGHWPAQLQALQREGLTLIHPDGRRSRHTVRATNDPATIEPLETALILVKSYQTEGAAREAGQFLAREGLAITLQNGLGNLEKLTAVLGADRCALGITAQGATMIEPGLVRHAGHGPTYLAAKPHTAGHLSRLATLFERAGMETHLVDDVEALVWGKLAINAAINPLTALLRLPNGALAEEEEARALMEAAAEEVAAVAAAQGIELPYPDAAAQALQVARATARNRSSMLQDILRGAPTEIEAICGAVVEYGRRSGVPTPVNEAFLHLVRGTESAL